MRIGVEGVGKLEVDGAAALRRAGDFRTDLGRGDGAGEKRGMPVVGGCKGDVAYWEEGVACVSIGCPRSGRGRGGCVIRSTVSRREGRSCVSSKGMSTMRLYERVGS